MVNTESVKYQAYVAGETRKDYIMYRKLLAEQEVVFKLLSSGVFLSQHQTEFWLLFSLSALWSKLTKLIRTCY